MFVFLRLVLSFTVFLTTGTIHFHCYLKLGNIFLTIDFIAFDFIILSYLNSNPDNIVHIFFIRVFLDNCLMCLNISLIVPKKSKSF